MRFFLYNILIFIGCIASYDLIASSQTKTSNGSSILWNGTYPSVILSVNSSSATDLSSIQVQSIVGQSISQWNSKSSISLSMQINNASNSSGINSLFFTSSSPYLSSATVGVTTMSYTVGGDLLDADIILNDGDFTFTSNPLDTSNGISSTIYLGDVVTHEIGHLLGLGHSEVMNSTMAYAAFRGQHTLSYDDKSVIEMAYPLGNKGTIRGKIIGSDDLIGVFGAHVQIISASESTVAGAVYSAPNGDFEVGGLSLNDTYYIYIGPIKLASVLPNYYSTAQTNFCSSGSYVGSFFSKCGDDNQGVAQAISLSASSVDVDVGNITIRCNYQLPQGYLENKAAIPRSDINLFTASAGKGVGKAVTGMFFSNEFSAIPANRLKDTYVVDLSAFEIPAAGDYYLEVKLLSQLLYSPVDFEINVTRADGMANEMIFATEFHSVDSDGVPDLNVFGRYLLSNIQSENIFKISITPIEVNPLIYNSYFPDPTSYLSQIRFYFMMIHLAVEEEGEYLLYDMVSDTPYEDNSYCTDGPNTYSINASISSLDSYASRRTKVDEKDNMFPTCATVDYKEPPSNSFGITTLFGVLLSFMIFRFLLLIRSE